MCQRRSTDRNEISLAAFWMGQRSTLYLTIIVKKIKQASEDSSDLFIKNHYICTDVSFAGSVKTYIRIFAFCM